MAGPTRLELATSGVTGRRSNQLNYDPAWSERGMIAYQPPRFNRNVGWVASKPRPGQILLFRER